MKRPAHPVLSYLYLASEGLGLPIVLVVTGLLAMATGWAVGYWLPDLYSPFWLYAALGGFAIAGGLTMLLFPRLRRQAFDLAFLAFLSLYLGTVFLAFTNNLQLEFLAILVTAHILFGISFRTLRDFLLFAVGTLALYTFCAFYLPDLVTGQGLLLSLMALATLFSGLYVWSRNYYLRSLNRGSLMLHDLLDTSHYAIFLLDQQCERVIYQNRIASHFTQEVAGKSELKSADLLQLLGLEPYYISRRFQVAPADLQEKSFYTFHDKSGAQHELEIYLNKVRTRRADHIQLKIRDITAIRDQERSLTHSRSVNTSLIHALPDILLTVDEAGIVQSAHGLPESGEPLAGDRAVGQPLAHLLAASPADIPALEALVAEARQGDDLRQANLVLGDKETPRYYELRLVRLGDGPDLMAIIRDTTEARQAERALQQSERNYREIFNTGTDGILILKPETLQPLDVNQILCDLLGCTREVLLAQPLEELCEPAQAHALTAFLRGSLEGQESLLECALRQAGGGTLQAELSARLVLLGGEFRLMLLVRDIHERIEKRRALEESEARLRLFRTLINQSTDAIFVLDPQSGRVLDFNEQTSESLGYSQEEMRNLHIFGFGLNIDHQPVPEEALEGLKAAGSAIYRGRHRRKDGSSFPVEVTIRYVRWEDKEYLVGVARDITERLEQEEALRTSEFRYRNLVEKMNEGLVLTGPEEQILFVNDRACEILGVDREELLHRLSYEVLSGEGVADLIRSKSRLRLEGISDQYELRLTRPDGEEIWVLVTGSPYADPHGRITGTLAILTDITARKWAELKLMEKNQELDAFVYKASHDLKGPLASIIGVTNIASVEVQEERAREFFALIAKSTNRLDLILTDLMEVTRANKVPIDPQPLRVATLVEDIFHSLRHSPKSARMDFRMDIPFDEPVVSDRNLLTSILQNLVMNSINYQDPEANPPWVAVQAAMRPGHVEISVQDNGTGIPKDLQERVFEMFFRGNTQSKGSGLGLYIVKKSLEKLGGQLRLHSEPGQGTTFTLLVPLLSLPSETPAMAT